MMPDNINKPLRAVPVTDSADVPIHVIRFRYEHMCNLIKRKMLDLATFFLPNVDSNYRFEHFYDLM